MTALRSLRPSKPFLALEPHRWAPKGSGLLVLLLVLLSAAASAQCRKRGCPAAERDPKGCCPSQECRRKGCLPSERDSKGCCPVPRCAEGRTLHSVLSGACCWAGQGWSAREQRCTGTPLCPSGYSRVGNTCLTKPATDEGGVALFGTEITVGQYRACVDAGVCSEPDSIADCNWPYVERASHPVNCVDFVQATTYCAWVNARLPSDAEWLEAATWGGASKTPWGGDVIGCDRVVHAHDGPGCGIRTTWPVCSKPSGSTPAGHCDLLGGVFEWTTSVPESQPTWRIIEGGSWVTSRAAMVSASSSAAPPTLRSPSMGFRCFRDPPAAGSAKAAPPAAPEVKENAPLQ